jgi:hypothetical protein
MIQHVVRARPGTLIALSVLTGLAIWLTCGSFDLLLLDQAFTRAAMLPPWWTLPLAILLAFVVLVAIVSVAAITGGRRLAATQTAARHLTVLDPRAVSHVILPCAALGLLLLPYLPWLPDRLPILWVLAGPGRLLVWLVVAWLVARGLWQVGGIAPVWLTRRARRGALAVFLVTAVVSTFAAQAFKRSALFPGGDEPHYLVIAQSLWRDHDLQIENNHKRGDYHEYFDRDLGPHYLVRGVNHEIYSIHPVGLPFLIAPVYALGGYELVVWLVVAMASAAAALLWLIARHVTGDEGAATAAWAACCLNGVWIFNSFAVYPEVPAALAAMAAFALVQPPLAASPRAWRRWLGAGVALATLPWLSTKYAPMSAMLVLVALGRAWWPVSRSTAATLATQPTLPPLSARSDDIPSTQFVNVAIAAKAATRNVRAALIASAAVIVPYAISLAGWFAFFYAIWGTPWPSAPYGTQHETSWRFLLSGAPGLLFDQEYGALAFAPALMVSLAGLVAMLRAGGAARRLALEIAVPFAALLVTVGAFHIWWGGSAVVGRPIISGLLLLGVPFAWRYQQQRDTPAMIGAYHLLMAIGAAFGLALGFAQNGLMLAASRNGVSRLLEWLSPDWSFWSLAPAFIVQTPALAALLAACWIAAACLAGWWLRSRPGTRTPGGAMLSAMLTGATAMLLVSLILPLLAGRWGAAPAIVPMSVRSRLLDEFDAARRPVAMLFDPLRRVDPQSLPPLVEFVARADDRRPKQPIPLLYNARFALPAGRYAVALVSATNDARSGGATPAPESRTLTGTLAMQLGRVGPPARRWDIDISFPGVWGRAFDLPIDVGFVGFHGSPEVEQAKPVLRIRPVSIVDAHARLPDLEVIATHPLADATLFFHDDLALPEGAGFWTPGRSRFVLTVAAAHEHPPRVRLRAGPVRTSVRLAAEGWHEDVTLEPLAERDLTLPMPAGNVTRLVFETSTGFVPSRLDPANHDDRLLGCWVELNPADPLH